VAVGTQDNQILRVVVLPVPVNMGDLKHRRNAEAAVGAKRIIRGKGDLPVVDPFCHLIFPSQRQNEAQGYKLLKRTRLLFPVALILF